MTTRTSHKIHPENKSFLVELFIQSLENWKSFNNKVNFSSRSTTRINAGTEDAVKKLKVIGVGSVFRLSLVLGAVAGILVGFVLMVMDLIDHRFLEGFVTLLLAPVLYGVLGALVNALMAWIYNIVAERLGGIEITLED
jgi:cation transporter-like permease